MEVEDPVGDLYNFVEGPLHGPAVADLTGLAIAIEGDELVVRFDTAGGWVADLMGSFTRASYTLHVEWDGPGAGSIAVEVASEEGRWVGTAWGWPENVPLDDVAVGDGNVNVRVPLSILGPPDDLVFKAETSFSDIPDDRADSLGESEELPWTQWFDRVPDPLDEWLTLTSGVVIRPLFEDLDS